MNGTYEEIPKRPLGSQWTLCLAGVWISSSSSGGKEGKVWHTGEVMFLSWESRGSLRAGGVEGICQKLEKAAAVSGICLGVAEENSGKILGKTAGNIFPNRKMLQVLGFRALGKANLPRTLGRHCTGRCPNLPCGLEFLLGRAERPRTYYSCDFFCSCMFLAEFLWRTCSSLPPPRTFLHVWPALQFLHLFWGWVHQGKESLILWCPNCLQADPCFWGKLISFPITDAEARCQKNCSLHRQDYRPDFYYFSNNLGNELPTLTLPENILGNSWLLESLQYVKVQSYRHPVYRLEVVLAIV